ncbi:MAG: triose-phosphate isomerase [Desulfobulbus propionicus]|nr:MAG: triose-phosphate isomerase [Desulfobulbus propionicus]
MARKPILAGNWKMHFTVDQAVQLALELARTADACRDREVMIAPPYTALDAVSKAVQDSRMLVGAQNVCWQEQGALTGEISPTMLQDCNVSMVIIGHSERRQLFNESDAMINQRMLGALHYNLAPVFCIGETLEEREAGDTLTVLEQQIIEGLKGIDAAQMSSVVIAYEPIWAIGTGQTASTEQAQEAHRFIRQLVENKVNKTVAEKVRILYGGSVKPENVDALMAQPDIDGALVGGAALQFESFARIINFI